MPFHLKSGRAFWTWHSPVKRSFVAGKEFCDFFGCTKWKPVEFNLVLTANYLTLPHLSMLESSLLNSVFLPPMEQEACPSLKLCHEIIQFPLPMSVLAESDLFYKVMKYHEKTLCLIIVNTDEEEWYGCNF